MEQHNLFGFLLSAIERRLSTYFGEDKIVQIDGKQDNQIIYSEGGILPSYSSTNFDKCNDCNMDTYDFNQKNQSRKLAKIIPDCENQVKPNIEETSKVIVVVSSLGTKGSYCDMV